MDSHHWTRLLRSLAIRKNYIAVSLMNRSSNVYH